MFVSWRKRTGNCFMNAAGDARKEKRISSAILILKLRCRDGRALGM